MTKEKKEISERYNQMKGFAQKGYKQLPDDFNADIIDQKFWDCLFSTPYKKVRRNFNEEMSIEFVENFRHWYECEKEVITNFKSKNASLYEEEKRKYMRIVESDRRLNQYRIKCAEIINILRDPQLPFSLAESMIMIFELLENCTQDKITVSRIKNNLIPFWLTGCKLDEEERKEVLKDLPKGEI